MKLRYAITAVFCLLLVPVMAQAWGYGPGYGYYGAGPWHGGMDGNFSFGGAMRSRGAGWQQPHYYPPRYPVQAWNAGQPNWIIRGVNFKYDSAELTPASMDILDSVAAVVVSRPAQPLEVGGHASAEGDRPYNQSLSERRAETVRAYLVARGVKPGLLTWRGYGESRPLASNQYEPGRQINRRVELMPVALLRQSR